MDKIFTRFYDSIRRFIFSKKILRKCISFSIEVAKGLSMRLRPSQYDKNSFKIKVEEMVKRIDHRMILGFFIVFIVSLIINGILANYQVSDAVLAKFSSLKSPKPAGITKIETPETSAVDVKPEPQPVVEAKVESLDVARDKEILVPEVKPAPKAAPKPAPAPVSAPAPQPKPVPASQSAPVPVANNMVEMVNAARKASGLDPVKSSSLLNQAALAKSKDMATRKYFSHTNPDGRNDFWFIGQVGYKYSAAASNIAQGNFGSEKGLFDAWMKSPGHRANILNSSVTEIGYAGSDGYYTMLLAKPR